jgi:ribosomal protein L11 methyltransferase
MSLNYIEYAFKVIPKEPTTEILIAQLGFVGFESFVENEDGLNAYIQENDWSESILDTIQILQSDEFIISYTRNTIEQINWNSQWEKNFNPIQVKNTINVRAPFHENLNLKYDIIIEPKMSFGTGHHETTHLMLEHLLDLDLQDKKVLDMGCGTGILAIFSEMKGAQPIDAIDIDNWCYENSIENISKNNCEHISVYQGDASLLAKKKYDLIIANINRNILLNDMSIYCKSLKKGGCVLFSGFYQEDIPVIDKAASELGLVMSNVLERNNWVALKYLK